MYKKIIQFISHVNSWRDNYMKLQQGREKGFEGHNASVEILEYFDEIYQKEFSSQENFINEMIKFHQQLPETIKYKV